MSFARRNRLVLYVKKDQIILRQRGLRYLPGENVRLGRDHSLNARIPGRVLYEWDPIAQRRIVHVKVPAGAVAGAGSAGLARSPEECVDISGLVNVQ